MAGSYLNAAVAKPATAGGGALRQKTQKTVTGCVGCRLRRKKCDETKPGCLGCARNGILCVFPEAGNEEHARLLRRTNCTRRQLVRGVKRNQWELDSRIYPKKSVSSPDLPTEHKAHLNTTNRTEGLITSDIKQCIMPGNPHLRQAASQRLLQHYIHRTSKAMATCRDMESPFLTELIPVAMANDELVLNAILACSGVHLAALSDSPATAVTWVHYGQAVQGQKFALTQLVQGNNEPLISATITAILLCIVETFTVGAGKQAMNHLKAARAMVRQVLELPEGKLDRGIRVFLIERVSYMITLAHVSMAETTDQSALDDTEVLFSTIPSMPIAEGSVSSGCVHDLFRLIPRVSAVAHQGFDEIRSAGQFAPETVIEYEYLICSVLSWKPSSSDEIYNSCGRIYQQALLAYLSSVFDAALLPRSVFTAEYSSTTRDALDCMTELLGSMALDAPITTTLCWPLAIFGACARTPAHQTFLDEKLGMLTKAYASQSIRDTRSLLQRLWNSRRPRYYSPLELEQLMREENITILFL